MGIFVDSDDPGQELLGEGNLKEDSITLGMEVMSSPQRKKTLLITPPGPKVAQYNPYIDKMLSFNIKRKIERLEPHFSDFMKLTEESMESSPSLFHTMDEIIDIINYEPRVVEHGFKPDVVERIVEILQCSNSESIKISATYILALSGLHKCESEIINKAIQVLVDLVRDEIITNRALCTLIRLASVFPEHAITIVDKNAIDVAFNVVTNCKGDFETLNCVATLLVLVCQVTLSPDEERVVLAILDKLIQTNCHLDHHIVRACDALQYRSFRKHMELEEQAFKRIIALIYHSNEKVASSALGVVGNIARWGTVDQVQSLAQDSELLKCLGRTMRGKPEEFLKEACQIILHLSAYQGGTFIRAVGEAGLIDNLCSLLEVAESDAKMEVACAKFDIKMEAACAIYNCIKPFL